jgi:thymidylate synthase
MIYTRPSMHEDFCKDGMSDFICTNTVQYFIRENSMHAIVSMRSNDAWAGYRNDYAWQLHVLKKLLNDYNRLTESNVDLGHIIWNVGNLHVYSSQFYLIDHFDLTGQHSISKEEYRKFYPKVRPYAN